MQDFRKIVSLQSQIDFQIKSREFSSVGSERLPYKQRVGGSNPSTPTSKCHSIKSGIFILIRFGFEFKSPQNYHSLRRPVLIFYETINFSSSSKPNNLTTTLLYSKYMRYFFLQKYLAVELHDLLSIVYLLKQYHGNICISWPIWLW